MAKYIAGWNMPGCLPEMEPCEFDSFKSAKQFITSELDTQGEIYESEDFIVEAQGLAGCLKCFATPTMPDGYVYWVDVMEE